MVILRVKWTENNMENFIFDKRVFAKLFDEIEMKLKAVLLWLRHCRYLAA